VVHRGVTANTGIEALGENLDVFAEETPGPSIERIDHEQSTRALMARGANGSGPRLQGMARSVTFDARIDTANLQQPQGTVSPALQTARALM
jgi:hypothetical protein